MLQSEFVRRGIEREAHGTKVVGISPTRLGSVAVELPGTEEQTKIADALSAIDTKIGIVTNQIDYMVAFKKGLLQQMFV